MTVTSAVAVCAVDAWRVIVALPLATGTATPFSILPTFSSLDRQAAAFGGLPMQLPSAARH